MKEKKSGQITLKAIAFLASSSVSLAAYAQESAPEVGKHVAGNMDLASMLVSLFLVLGLIVVSAFVLKKFHLGSHNHQGLKVISSLHLGTKERLVVVEVNKKQLLLGVTANQINVLETLDEPLTQNQVLPQNLMSNKLSEQLLKAIKK